MTVFPALPISGFPLPNDKLESFGFKLTGGGAHISRTIMLKEITVLLSRTSSSSTLDEYADKIILSNILGKATVTTREKTLRHLKELYLLSKQYALFRVFRHLVDYDQSSIPQLAFLVAWTRDPLLRATTDAIYKASIGSEVLKIDLVESLDKAFRGRYSPLNIGKIARNASSSWTQSGHLMGRTKKIRKKVDSSPASVALALYIGSMAGWNGEQLLATPWCQLLDLNSEHTRSLAVQAHREGLINFRAVGSVVDISFTLLETLPGGTA
jgi:hypothetical protein